MGTTTGGAAYGIQRLIDANARFFRSALPCYYIEANSNVDNTDFAQLGMMYVSSASSGQALGGTTSTLVDPPVAVRAMTLKNLSDAANVGSDLRLGAKIFTFSHTWVQNIMKGNFPNGVPRSSLYTNERNVFNGQFVVGFKYDGLLYNFDSFVDEDAYGAKLSWTILCNANEIK